jgi:hypothetical protein
MSLPRNARPGCIQIEPPVIRSRLRSAVIKGCDGALEQNGRISGEGFVLQKKKPQWVALGLLLQPCTSKRGSWDKTCRTNRHRIVRFHTG